MLWYLIDVGVLFAFAVWYAVGSRWLVVLGSSLRTVNSILETRVTHEECGT